MIYAANGQRDKAETLYLKHRQAENPSVYDIGGDARYLAIEPQENLTANQQLFCRICDLMDSSDHIYTDADLDRNRLAQLLGTNEHYVTDAISACADGKSVNGFLNEYRVRHAAHLLATTNDSVALIAELSGFSRSSFFRIFSETYGTFSRFETA